MQTVNASVILEDAERLLGWDIDQLETRQKQIARTALSLALQEVWESWWWSHLMKSETVAGAPVYAAATTYAAGDNVYFPATQKFYQCMAASTGNAPAIYSDGSWTTTYEYWAEAKSAYSGDDFVAGTTYQPGDIVRNPVDGQFYQRLGGDLFTQGTWSDPFIDPTFAEVRFVRQPLGTVINVSAVPSDLVTTYPSVGSVYKTGSGPNDRWLGYNSTNAKWVIVKRISSTFIVATGNTLLGEYDPEYATYFITNPEYQTGSMIYAPATLGPSDDSLNWGLLTPFVPTCAISGHVRAVGDQDPRNRACLLYSFDETAEGVRIPDLTAGVPWIWYRRATPILTGDDYSATATYTAAETLTYD